MTFKEKVNTVVSLIKRLLSNPKSIFLVFKDEDYYQKQLQKKYGQTQFPTVDVAQFIQPQGHTLDYLCMLDGSSTIVDLLLLKNLALTFEHCDYLEIGSWRGESIMNVADVKTADCVSFNLSKEEIVALTGKEKYADLHACLISKRDNLTEIKGNSLTFDFESLNRRFDLIFIDGDHKYHAVKSDTQKMFPLLKDENSIIVWHDYAYNPERPRYSVIQGIMDGMPESEHQHLYHVSNSMCAIYCKKNLQGVMEDFPSFPKKLFSLKVDIKDNH